MHSDSEKPMKPDAGKEATAVIGKVPVPWKCGGSSSSSNKWVGLNIEGLFYLLYHCCHVGGAGGRTVALTHPRVS